MDERFVVLAECALFKNKSAQEIEVLLAEISFRTEVFSEGDTVFSPVQKADRIGIILSGAVDEQKLFPSGKVVIIERKKRAGMIAESCVFSRLECYSDAYVACKPCEILILSKSELLGLFQLDQAVFLNFLEHIANSTLVLKRKIGILSLDSIQEKISGYLFHAYLASGSLVVPLPFSKKEWAEYMDVSRTSLSRELRKMDEAGVLSFNKRTIEIRDMDKLEKILSL